MARRKKKAMIGWKGQLLGIVGLFTAIVFMPTTIILLLGMIPTIVAAVIDRSGRGTKALTVGAMNVAGCVPFLINLWTESHTPEMAVTIISDPRTMIVIYSAAGIGYLISWAMGGIVGTVMVQRSNARLIDIETRQQRLIERWGPEVGGDIPLDPYGFPLEPVEKQEESDTNDDDK